MSELDRVLDEVRSIAHRITERHTDPRLDEILAGVRCIQQEIERMSGTQDTLTQEVATLKTNMANLHAGLADLQTRLANITAAGIVSDPAALAELSSINADLASVVTTLAQVQTPTPPIA
jgi:chromosome segregation ATPase